MKEEKRDMSLIVVLCITGLDSTEDLEKRFY